MIRIGIIGAGPNAVGHAEYYFTSSRAQLVAIADPALDRAEALAKATGSKAVADFRSFLSDVDAVVVASPNFLHREQAIAVAKAGKHLYCEKPQGLSHADALAIADAVRTAKVASQVGFATRNDPTTGTMLRLAREGRFGEVFSVCSRRLMYMDTSKTAGWRADPALSGGLLMEINIHELEWMMEVGGPVQSVFARTWSKKPGHPRGNDHVWFTLNFSGSATGIHEGSWHCAMPQFFRSVVGTSGGAQTDEWGSSLLVADALGKDRQPFTCDKQFDIRGNFLDAIEGRAAAVCDVLWGSQVMAVAEAIVASAQSGQVVGVVPPALVGVA